jgi:hypothetical protein
MSSVVMFMFFFIFKYGNLIRNHINLLEIQEKMIRVVVVVVVVMTMTKLSHLIKYNDNFINNLIFF